MSQHDRLQDVLKMQRDLLGELVKAAGQASPGAEVGESEKRLGEIVERARACTLALQAATSNIGGGVQDFQLKEIWAAGAPLATVTAVAVVLACPESLIEKMTSAGEFAFQVVPSIDSQLQMNHRQFGAVLAGPRFHDGAYRLPARITVYVNPSLGDDEVVVVVGGRPRVRVRGLAVA